MDPNGIGTAENPKEGVGNRIKCVHSKNNPSCFENVSHYFCEFCDQTSMHGFNLLAERGRTIPERIYWTMAILAGAYLSVVLVRKSYKDWLNSPVIVTFATTQLGVWDIPFPALTICPQIKSHKHLFNYTDIYLKKEKEEEVTMNETKEFEYMSLLCSDPFELQLNESEITIDENAMKFLRKVAPTVEDMIFGATWLGDEYKDENLVKLFSPILTSEGVCYTFNNMDRSEIFTDVVTYYENDYFSTSCKPSEWSTETGFLEDSEIFSSCPKRTLSAGIKAGLSLMFTSYDFDIDYICSESLQGYKVILHHPAEIPGAEMGYFFVPLDQSVVVAIKPNVMTTSENLVHYKATDRQCYFSSEKSLKFFKIYNQQNCLVECLTNFTLKTCGCVQFHMPRENSTPICSAGKSDCIENAKATFLTNEEIFKLIYDSRKNSRLETQHLINAHCNCLPSCTSLQFDFEYSQADWDWREYLKIQNLTPSWDSEEIDLVTNYAHLSDVVVFFKDMQFATSERNELKGQLELWSDFGGLLGLFLGFSFITAFELLYYLTLRLICNVRLFGRRYWSGSERLLEVKEIKIDTELQEL